MQLKSQKSLLELVEQAEEIEQRIRSLNAATVGVTLPHVPEPLRIETLRTWLQVSGPVLNVTKTPN